MKIPPISAYLEILPFSDFSPSPSFYKRTRVECSATGVPRGTIEKFISDLIFRKESEIERSSFLVSSKNRESRDFSKRDGMKNVDFGVKVRQVFII